jgi:hypothetical protein
MLVTLKLVKNSVVPYILELTQVIREVDRLVILHYPKNTRPAMEKFNRLDPSPIERRRHSLESVQPFPSVD